MAFAVVVNPLIESWLASSRDNLRTSSSNAGWRPRLSKTSRTAGCIKLYTGEVRGGLRSSPQDLIDHVRGGVSGLQRQREHAATCRLDLFPPRNEVGPVGALDEHVGKDGRDE